MGAQHFQKGHRPRPLSPFPWNGHDQSVSFGLKPQLRRAMFSPFDPALSRKRARGTKIPFLLR